MAQAVEGGKGESELDTGAGTYPVKTGGVYKSTQPTYTDNQRTSLQTDTRGNLKVTVVAPDTNAGGIAASTIVMAASSVSASTAIAVTNPGYPGIMAFMNITSAFPGSASTTYALKIKAVSPMTAGVAIVLGNCTPRSASGQSVLVIYPGIQVVSATTGPISTFSMGLPRDIQIVASLSAGATSKEVVLALGYMWMP